VLCGEGIWRWRIKNYQLFENHDCFNDWVNKTVLYLAMKVKKERFRVTANSVYDETSPLIFGAELYNDNFEPVNEPDVTLEIKDNENQSFAFVFDKSGMFYQLNAGFLAPGDYTYTAKTTFGGKEYRQNGKFIIVPSVIESSNLTANFDLLMRLSSRTGGKSFLPDQLSQLKEALAQDENIQAVSFTDKKLTDLIEIKAIFFILLSLAVVEWFLRRYFGSY
jgi:hypothetical protein